MLHYCFHNDFINHQGTRGGFIYIHIYECYIKTKRACVSARNIHKLQIRCVCRAIWEKIHSTSSAVFRHGQHKHFGQR